MVARGPPHVGRYPQVSSWIWVLARPSISDKELLSLNLVIVRTATPYGPYSLSGIVTPRITLGRVYKYLNEEMKYL